MKLKIYIMVWKSGGMPEMVLEYVLKQNGLKIGEDLEIINNIAFESTAGAFVGEVGDYTAEFEPTATTLEQQGNGYVVASLGKASGYVPYTVYMATNEFLKNHADVVQKFTNAIYKGQLWVQNHSSEEIAQVILPQFPETDVETLAKIVERYKEQDTWKENPILEEESLTLIENILEDAGELEKPVPYKDLVTTEFARKAIENIQ